MSIPYFEGFDYGGEVADNSSFKLWPTEGTRVGLVDADLLPYQVGFTVDEADFLKAQALLDEGLVSDLRDTEYYKESLNQLCSSLNKWLRLAKCDAAVLYDTDSKNNFRLNIAFSDPYKGQRPEEKPPFFAELKQDMSNLLGCVLSEGNEADDMLSIHAWKKYYNELEPMGILPGSKEHKEFCDVVVISTDKDSTITPCWHLNPVTKELFWTTLLGELNPKYKDAMVNDYQYVGTGEYYTRGAKKGEEKIKRVLVGLRPSSAITKLSGSGLKFFYAQILMGDMADNYKGLPGCGMTGAYKLLEGCKTEKDLYLTVLKAYKEHYGSGEHWCPHYRGTEQYYNMHQDIHGCPPADWEFWEGKGTYLTAYDRMLEQGRLAWMQTKPGEIWRADKGRIIDPNDKEFWHD